MCGMDCFGVRKKSLNVPSITIKVINKLPPGVKTGKRIIRDCKELYDRCWLSSFNKNCQKCQVLGEELARVYPKIQANFHCHIIYSTYQIEKLVHPKEQNNCKTCLTKNRITVAQLKHSKMYY